MKTLAVTTLFLLFFGAAFTQNNTNVPGADNPEIGVTEHLDTLISRDIRVIDEKNDTVPLVSLIDKPTILNLVYYRCPGICSPIMNSLSEVVDKMGMEIGKDYQILTVSFDYRETNDLGIKKKQNYLRQMKTKINPDGWKFMTADSLDIVKLTNCVGFRFKLVGENYIHPGMIAILSPKAKVTRYLYGTYFLPFEVKLALAEASKGQSGPTINRVLEFCYSYDPQGRQYVLNVTKVAGALILFIALVIFIVLIIKPKRKKTTTNKE